MRVWVNRVWALILCLVVAAAGQTRHSLLHKLSKDLTGAIERATLKDKDRKKLEDANRDLVAIADLKRLGRADRDDLKKALDQIRKRTKSFAGQDRQAIEEDLRQAHDLRLDRGAPPARPRPPRPPAPPRPPVYPMPPPVP